VFGSRLGLTLTHSTHSLPHSLPHSCHSLFCCLRRRECRYNDKVYLRLAHLFEAGEHPTLSAAVNVSLATIFAGKLKLKSLTEVSLSGNRSPAELAAAKLVWPVAGEAEQMPSVAGCAAGASCAEEMRPVGDDMVVRLRPMDIRTFQVEFE